MIFEGSTAPLAFCLGFVIMFRMGHTTSKSPLSRDVNLEVAGPLAMFARPDTGGVPTSYPVPTWSAAKGLFESIAFLSSGDAYFHPIQVEVCRRVGDPGGRLHWQAYTTNYGGPLRKSNQLSSNSPYQLIAHVLTNVCFRLRAEVWGAHLPGRNPKHYLQDLFQRRLRQGRCHRTPCLGWSEFTCSYWGAPRHGVTEVDDALDLTVPSMLVEMWDESVGGSYAPRSDQDAELEGGVLRFEEAAYA